MKNAEELLVKIKFVVDMYNSGANTADDALEMVFDLVDNHEKEVTE